MKTTCYTCGKDYTNVFGQLVFVCALEIRGIYNKFLHPVHSQYSCNDLERLIFFIFYKEEWPHTLVLALGKTTAHTNTQDGSLLICSLS